MTKPIDIYSLPLYYISFEPNKDIEDHYREHGFNNVYHFNAVDGRKIDPNILREDNLITIRSYDDLISGRRCHSGMPSLGAIGCTLSHYELWKKCINTGWPYIIIAEEDNRISRKLSEENIIKIVENISKPKGIFISANIIEQDHRKHFFGTNFYFASRDACKEMIKYCFPIDVQTDWYIAHLGTTNKIHMGGYKISSQKSGKTHIQDSCITCWLPTNKWVYIITFTLITFLITFITLLVFYFKVKWTRCKKTLPFNKYQTV